MTPSPTRAERGAPTLLVLAAGRSSRFGAPKQFAPVGPNGETLLDYALFDAARAGFARAVLVIAPGLGPRFADEVVTPWRARLPVALVEQRLEDLPPGFGVPPGRSKPWGTVHAVLAARSAVPGAFAVINADDYYGPSAYSAIAEWLRVAPPTEWALVGYPLRSTLPPEGAVNRAHCVVDEDGWLVRIEELLGVEPGGENAFVRAPDGMRVIGGGETVSMNCWGFSPAVYPGLQGYFHEFLRRAAGEPEAECPLPEAVQGLIQQGAGRVKVLPRGERWVGITHPGDLPRVQAYFADLVNRGVYPPLRGRPRSGA